MHLQGIVATKKLLRSQKWQSKLSLLYLCTYVLLKQN